MTTNAIAVARADRNAKRVAKLMNKTFMPFAVRLAALNAMGKENRLM